MADRHPHPILPAEDPAAAERPHSAERRAFLRRAGQAGVAVALSGALGSLAGIVISMLRAA